MTDSDVAQDATGASNGADEAPAIRILAQFVRDIVNPAIHTHEVLKAAA